MYRSVATFVIAYDRVIRRVKATGESTILNEEFERVLNKLPKLKKAGMHKGKPVNVMYTLPLTINIDP